MTTVSKGKDAKRRMRRSTTPMTESVSLVDALRDEPRRAAIAADAVAEAENAVRDRTGFGGMSARFGLDAINRLRPGFLQRHLHAMLPEMALAIEPHWRRGSAQGDSGAHIEANAEAVTKDLLAVADAYVATARDSKAIAVYNQLRSRAPERVAEQMPRIADFIERHSPSRP
ncbi:MAG: hypothetical protein ACI8Y4_005628 [Candidatus Poriferisodalaceae bacterium]|jgi:hypothetical protein